jgi:hypothetical protein
MFVPSWSNVDWSWARLDAEMPSTATIAAMPIAMPRADSTARSGRARSPAAPSRARSAGVRALDGLSFAVEAGTVFGLLGLGRPVIWLLLFGALFRPGGRDPGFDASSYLEFLTPGSR